MDKRFAALVTLGLLAFAASVVGVLNAILGFASATVAVGLGLAVVFLAAVVTVVSLSTHEDEPDVTDVALGFSSDDDEEVKVAGFGRFGVPLPEAQRPSPPRPSPPQAKRVALSVRGPSLVQIGLVVGICAGVVTFVNGVIEFFSTSVHKL